MNENQVKFCHEFNLEMQAKMTKKHLKSNLIIQLKCRLQTLLHLTISPSIGAIGQFCMCVVSPWQLLPTLFECDQVSTLCDTVTYSHPYLSTVAKSSVFFSVSSSCLGSLPSPKLSCDRWCPFVSLCVGRESKYRLNDIYVTSLRLG